METRHVCRSKSPNTHLCSNDLSKNERRWPSCLCVYKLTESSTKGTCTGRVSPHPCSAMFTPANHCTGYNSHWTQSGRVYKTGTVAVDGPTERYARGPCNRLRKFCFCVTTAARPLYLPWTIKAAVVAQQVAQKRQSEGRTIAMVPQVLPWSLNGGTVVATVIAQWTPWVGQKRHNGGTRKADVSLKLIHNVRIFYWATNGRPLCIRSATTLMCVPSSCLLWATCERPTSSATFVRLFWTCSKLHGVHGDVWTSYVPPLNDQGNRSASLLPSMVTWPVLWAHKGGTKVAAPV